MNDELPENFKDFTPPKVSFDIPAPTEAVGADANVVGEISSDPGITLVQFVELVGRELVLDASKLIFNESVVTADHMAVRVIFDAPTVYVAPGK